MKDLLVEARVTATQTRLMYNGNLTHEQVKLYIRTLQKHEFIDGKKTFQTTKKGELYIIIYKTLKALMT